MPKTTRIHGGIDASRVNDLQDAGIVHQTFPRFLRVAGRHRRHLAASTLGIGAGRAWPGSRQDAIYTDLEPRGSGSDPCLAVAMVFCWIARLS